MKILQAYVLGLTETYWQKQVISIHHKTTYCMSGNENKSENGVTMIISSALKHLITGYRAVNNGIIHLKLYTYPVKLNIQQMMA